MLLIRGDRTRLRRNSGCVPIKTSKDATMLTFAIKLLMAMQDCQFHGNRMLYVGLNPMQRRCGIHTARPKQSSNYHDARVCRHQVEVMVIFKEKYQPADNFVGWGWVHSVDKSIELSLRSSPHAELFADATVVRQTANQYRQWPGLMAQERPVVCRGH